MFDWLQLVRFGDQKFFGTRGIYLCSVVLGHGFFVSFGDHNVRKTHGVYHVVFDWLQLVC